MTSRSRSGAARSTAWRSTFGTSGTARGQLADPWDTDVLDGRIYVADAATTGCRSSGSGGPLPATVPPGPVEITGTAADPDGVGAVEVSVLDRTTGESWHAPSSSWRRSGSPVTAAMAGGDTTRQTFRWVLPAVRSGHRYVVQAQAYDADGVVSSAPLPAAELTVG